MNSYIQQSSPCYNFTTFLSTCPQACPLENRKQKYTCSNRPCSDDAIQFSTKKHIFIFWLMVLPCGQEKFSMPEVTDSLRHCIALFYRIIILPAKIINYFILHSVERNLYTCIFGHYFFFFFFLLYFNFNKPSFFNQIS